MKRFLLLVLALALLVTPLSALAEEGDPVPQLLVDMYMAAETPSAQTVGRLEQDMEAVDDPLILTVAQRWRQLYVDPAYTPLLYGRDDPKTIPVHGRHAFVVLGFELVNGEMTDELRSRCDAAAAAAAAFPESLVICTGGATGENNPDGHTEAGLMKAYLTDAWGLDPDRILTEEEAMDTAQNASNVMAMLQAAQVQTLTVITSHYHQRRGQVLYAAMAARYGAEQGYEVEVLDGYSYLAPQDPGPDYMIAMYQLLDILHLPDEQRDEYYHLMYGD